MGTRGCIARGVERTPGVMGFDGRYHHWDSYPTGLGETLYQLFNGFFKKNATQFLQVLIDDHPAGWSTINGCDFSLPAGYDDGGSDYAKKKDGTTDYDHPIAHGGRCYCHGTRHEGENTVTEKDAQACGCEWAYASDEKKLLMSVMSSYGQEGAKMIGMFGFGDDKASWKPVAIVDLTGAEPDWKVIEATGKE